MKKNYLIVMLALVCNLAMAQLQQTSYRGAFAPAPRAMWTDSWTNFDPNTTNYPTVTTVISSDITSNTTWTKNNVYELGGLITVRNNATLTIQAGTVIRSSVAASALVITRGAKLIANGTAAEPIVFTSKKAVNARQRGDWGGIVLLGKARYNTNNGVNYIEGISQNINTEFGGGLSPIDNDNSGSLRYVRIEYAGYVFSPNNELNGLTMGAVGSGTTIEYVQVSYSNDDSFEWFGGSVNCKYLVAFNGLDDDFDSDNGYKGVCQFGLSVKDPNNADISTSECFESDNNSGGTATTVSYGDFTSGIFSNFTCIGANTRFTLPSGGSLNALHDKALRIRRASQLKVFNSIFLDFKTGLVVENSLTQGYATSDLMKFRNNLVVASTSTLAFVAPSASNATAMTSWFTDSAKDNKTYTSSAGLLTRPYDNTNAQNYKLITDNSDTVNIDYRPASADATTGASFTDSSLSGLVVAGTAPGVSNRTYCRGVIAPALTANLTANGVSLRWYTSATTATFSTTAPVPTTSTVGTKSFWVAEVDDLGVVSSRAKIDVTTLASPTIALGTITGTVAGNPALTNVGPFVRTTTEFTYTVPASTEPGVASYSWTVPLGVNIISGQGTNSIIVNYNNVAPGLLKIGNIAVQALNADGCGGVAKTLAISATLPAAPGGLIMNDALLPVHPTTGIPISVRTFGKYMGQTTPLVVTAPAVVGATGYVWEIPSNVSVVTTGAPVVTTLYYNAFPFTLASSSAPTAGGNVYYKIVRTSYSNGVSYVTGRIIRNARTANPTLGITAISAFDNELTNLTNEGVTVNPAFPFHATTANAISVNFSNTTAANTFNYTFVHPTTGANIPTYVIRIGVKALNGVGASVSNNATLQNPTTSSSARLLTLTAVLPVAPSKITMNDAALPLPVSGIPTAVTTISKYIGTPTVLTLTAAPSLTASSYSWDLPAGVNLLSGSGTNQITVNFAGVASGITSLYIGVNSINGIGTSVVTTNGTLTPATTSTARLLKLTAAVPAAVSSVVGQIAGLCGNSAYNYTITPTALANSYIITAPSGSVVTSASNMSNASNVLATSDLTFTVTYPAGFVATATAPKTLAVTSVNGVGNSLTNRTINLSTVMASIGVVSGGTTFQRAMSQTFTATPVVGASTYTWTVADGATIVSGQGTNTVEVSFSAVLLSKTSTILKVQAANACGGLTAIKSITLLSTIPSPNEVPVIGLNATEVYPNPVSSQFNIDVTATKNGVLEVAIYSLDGNLVVSPKMVQLQEGENTISENVSSLKKGIYVLRLVNTLNNAVITKKLVKE